MKVKAVENRYVSLTMEHRDPSKKSNKNQKIEKSFEEHLKEQLEKKV